ncbi:2-succinyl-6-hydroxy-2,4-cyclohexadiene-1-carboxylate synthase [Yersinia ruckeri]|uniref:2-succinyl-6-hydroxy-2,4-cyclohexadiene-1-carboxylate synthase n=1 Tax=Yersinia ruckeri TaxID=29486 RepID=A0A085U4U5_YERRU|nr:2-succinyl-6-hydroxy-2,4-cyclohexadiene-1-carboxylate synthase [Yersinia ruckeri]ARZ00411.1 acyl-CoA thioester hydrolase [Yersinia ruckeri]AUQ42512.1 2-succinyl-6-hydroxy-2,4-cyclohexadiene-1-carboxylate synthase [Yersinia ruckeri]EKN4197712.1 2-succinyl-6-hydroxy-2,4-cyclohexadiene-1-carboxylate synthase [Yersinia ruckeri]EKN4203964.1 2-succinyl-6-hydroxy-2,4-cyclohexadiene-1-carboxylate synthase [Yersinia ruckeri]EKN4694766.1 2-succinyl-6-hydroxy-2,4-cyclohexadiene-1-carboxylate synthase 
MILASRVVNPQQNGPWLVWLHGLLGNGADWLPVVEACSEYPSLLVDLPGHGGSVAQTTRDFSAVSTQLDALLTAHNIQDYWLVGYSLGGRIAMYYACHADDGRLRGLLVEAANPGLEEDVLRRERLQHDVSWASRFRQEPIQQVLADWYLQPIFADLTASQRQQLVDLRSVNRGSAIAAMLEATSLGHQPYLLPALRQLSLPFAYLCGEQDHKFQQLAYQYRLPLCTIAEAGHNAHRANPGAFAAQVRSFLSLSR